MIGETIPERQSRMDTELQEDRTNLKDFRDEIRAHLAMQDSKLDMLLDDLKLRKWLAKFIKSMLIVAATILGVTHAPDWVRHIFGLQDIHK